MDADKTAQELAEEGRVGFRLTADTPLFGSADISAGPRRVLPKGSLVTVRSDAGPLLFVLTSDDEMGYIADETPVQPMTWTPEVERTLAEARAPVAASASTPQASPEQPARQWLDTMGSPVASHTQTGAMPLSAVDDDFTPALPPTPQERILIYDRIDANKRSTWIIMAGFVLFAAAFFTALAVIVAASGGVLADEDPILIGQMAVASSIIALGVGIIMYYFSTNTVLAISGGHQVTKAEEPVLYRIVENLSIGSGLPMPKVWVMEDSAPNAFATGRNPQNAHVAATRGLLDKLTKRELEAVMAHEMSHVGNYDIRLMTIVAVVVGLVALVSDLLFRFTWYGAGGRSSNKGKGGGAIGIIILVVAVIFIILSPIIATIMRMALSRQREYLADASGALLCRNPDALADALRKIAADPEPLEAANKATAHLYIENPLKEHKSMFNSLFSTHPPVEERIAILRAMA